MYLICQKLEKVSDHDQEHTVLDASLGGGGAALSSLIPAIYLTLKVLLFCSLHPVG